MVYNYHIPNLDLTSSTRLQYIAVPEHWARAGSLQSTGKMPTGLENRHIPALGQQSLAFESEHGFVSCHFVLLDSGMHTIN